MNNLYNLYCNYAYYTIEGLLVHLHTHTHYSLVVTRKSIRYAIVFVVESDLFSRMSE